MAAGDSTQLISDEEFSLTVEADGYQPNSQKLKLPEGSVKELNVVLQPAPKSDPDKPQEKRIGWSSTLPTRKQVRRLRK